MSRRVYPLKSIVPQNNTIKRLEDMSEKNINLKDSNKSNNQLFKVIYIIFTILGSK